MDILEKIKALRLQKRLSQLDVAEALAISQSAYAQLESGKTEITLTRVEQLAKLFGMTAIELLQYGEEKPQIVDNEKVKVLENRIKELEKDLVLLKDYYLGAILRVQESFTFVKYMIKTYIAVHSKVKDHDSSLVTLQDLQDEWQKRVRFNLLDDAEFNQHREESPLGMAKLREIFTVLDNLKNDLGGYLERMKKLYVLINTPKNL